MANYEFQVDTSAVLAAAQGACAKVTAICITGCRHDEYYIETNDDMTAPEIASVKAAVEAVPEILVKID